MKNIDNAGITSGINEIQKKYFNLLERGKADLETLQIKSLKYQKQKILNFAWKEIIKDLKVLTEKLSNDNKRR